LFATAIALPLVALIGFGLYDRAQAEFRAAEEIALRSAKSSADYAWTYVDDLRRTLEALARRPQVRAMDATRCDPDLEDLLALYPRAASFIVVNLDGAIVCSAPPLRDDGVVRIADEELLREMLAGPRFRMSQPILSRITKRWLVSAVQPVIDENGALVGTVAVGTELVRWRPFPRLGAATTDALLMLVTSDGTIIARSSESEEWVSRKMRNDTFMKHMLAEQEGFFRARGEDGVNRIWGFAQVAGLPWFALAGVPTDLVLGPARERLARTGGLVALTVGLLLASSWGVSARLSKPIARIAAAVRERAERRSQVRVPEDGPVEVNQVARELNRMIDSVAQAEAEIRRSNAELEARVRERTARLEDANKELEAFSYSVSHDLRAPVRHIDGFVKLLEASQPPANDDAARYLAKITAASRKMGELIDDLLTLSRTARAPLKRTDVDLGALVASVVQELQPDCAGRRIEWRIGPLPTVSGDRGLLRVLLQNLLSNSAKYTRSRELAVIEVGAERLESDEKAVFVRDNGVGFEMQYRDKLFGVFQRLHSDTEFDGTGIGLATARRIVVRHGGRIWGEGQPGHGATFYFTVEGAAE
jgi:signal transduction histidine kinase